MTTHKGCRDEGRQSPSTPVGGNKSHLVVRSFVAVALAGTALVVGGSPAGAGELKSRRFRTPSNNIHCHLPDGGKLRCDIMSGLNPEPKNKECDFDWVGLKLPRYKGAKANCASDTTYREDAPILDYGQRWHIGRLRCLSKKSGLRCWNSSGYNFKLSRDSWRKWYSP